MQPHLRAIATHLAEVEAQFADEMRRTQAAVAAALAGEEGEEQKATMKRARRTHQSPATRRTFAEIIVRHAYANAGLVPRDPLPGALVLGVLVGCGAAIEFEEIGRASCREIV